MDHAVGLDRLGSRKEHESQQQTAMPIVYGVLALTFIAQSLLAARFKQSPIDSKIDSNTDDLERMSTNKDEQENLLAQAGERNEGSQPGREGGEKQPKTTAVEFDSPSSPPSKPPEIWLPRRFVFAFLAA